MDNLTEQIALMLGASWASGINLYLAVLVLGLLGASGAVDLPPGLDLLTNPMVLLAAGVMYLVELVVDKVPGADSAWDGLHTFIRIPAGAMMAAGAMSGDVGTAGDLVAALIGGGVAASSHAAKAGTRVLINTSPEPFTNWTASVTEDLGVLGGLLLAINHPWAFLALLALFFVLLIWLMPKLWRGIKRVFGSIGRLFGGGRESRGTLGATPDRPVSAGPGPANDPGGDRRSTGLARATAEGSDRPASGL